MRRGHTLSPLFGRSREIGVLQSLLEEASRGTGRIAILEGEAGIGKTRLGQAVVEAAKGLGFQCFVGTAHELERERAFGVVIDALGLRSTAEDPARLEIVALLEEIPSGGADRRFPIIERAIELVEAIAISRPVLILVEDLHWADSSTILTLYRLAATVPHLPVAIVCTTRPQPRTSELTSFLNTLDPSTSLKLGIEALSAEAVAEIAAATLNASPGPHLLEQLGGAAGNPLFVSELLAALAQEGLVEESGGTAEVGEVSMPPSLRLTILRRLASLSDATLETLRVASVLGSVFSLNDVRTVTGKSINELLPLVEEAVATGLVGESGARLKFRHELVRDAIYQDMLEPIRKTLHAQAAQALAAAGAPTTQIAAHAAIGAEIGDIQAAQWLREAAQEITSRAPLVAIELLERALELASNDRAQADEIRLTLAWSYEANGREDEAANIARDVLAGNPDRDVRMAAQRVRFRALPWKEADEEIERALLDPSLNQVEKARLVGEKAAALRGNDNARALLEADRAIALSKAAGDTAGLFLGTWARAFCLGFNGDFEEAIEISKEMQGLSVAVRDEDSRAVYMGNQSRLLYVWSDRFDEAERDLEALRSEGAGAGETKTLLYHYARAHLELWAGRWDEAIAVAEAGRSIAPGYHNIHQLLAYVAIHRDELAAAALHLSRFEGGLWIPALLAEARGDAPSLEAALESYRPSLELERPWNIGVGLWTLPEWVRLYLTVDDRPSALVLTGVLEQAALRAKTPTARGAALRCRGLCEGDNEILLKAVDEYRTGPRVFDLAESCEWAAVGLGSRGGDGEQAVVLMEEALGTYESVGAARDIARVEAHLRSLGVRRGRRGARRRPKTGWESLTPSEERVTALVAEGLSYREIGDRLFISRRTVETHVVHIFAKLGLASRRELAELALEQGLGSHSLTQQA